MLRRIALPIFIISISVFLAAKSIDTASSQISGTPTLNTDTLATESAQKEFWNKICSGHGGINCSIINKDASIVCNDGIIDPTFPFIHGVPECRGSVEDFVTKESDFMAQSGCVPPSELRCIDELHYKNLYQELSKKNLVSSELGKGELTVCLDQIEVYQKESDNYKQCLINHGRPDFELSGKLMLPVLKVVFCPLLHGGKASYDVDLDLCLCDDGYFLQNNQCIQADQICQAKYGSQATAKNGSCSLSSITSKIIRTPTITNRSQANPTPSKTPSVTPTQTTANQPKSTVFSQTKIYITPTETPPQAVGDHERNFIQKIVGSIISGLKNMLKLF